MKAVAKCSGGEETLSKWRKITFGVSEEGEISVDIQRKKEALEADFAAVLSFDMGSVWLP